MSASLLLGVLQVTRAAPTNPCDVYGDCLNSSITYLRSNPDATLYPGDSFVVWPLVSLGSSTVSYSTSWSYDSAVLLNLGGGAFRVIANVSGTYTVTITATFTIVQTSGGTTVTLHSSLSTSQGVTLRAFVLTFTTQMGNVTNPAHQVLRNPDGSYFHEDAFFVNYTYSFLFTLQRSDIRVVVDARFDRSYVQLASFQNSSSKGYFLFTVANRTGTSSVTITARAFNYMGGLLGSRTAEQPFAVVNYAPYFTYFTYMEFNSRNSSAYERPFVTLIRYGGNNPGYSYGGDANTTPLTNVNDTHERALINAFKFTTTAWGVRANLDSGNLTQDLSFWNRTAVDIGLKTTNETFPVITFANRTVKFYFTSGLPKTGGYTAQRLEYFNVTELAISRHFAGGNHGLFNTSYLYEPFYYSGYITVFTYGPAGLDPSTSVNVTLVSPDPLNSYLLASLSKTFGSDPKVLHYFEADLFPANSYVMDLKPLSSSGGRWVFLLNDTNLAMANDTQMPYLYITVKGVSGSYSYSVPDAFSAFVVERSMVPSLPFTAVHGYYLDQQLQLVALPLNYSLTSANPYVAWDFGGAPSFASLTYEPGNLSRTYGFLYGGNSTIYANLEGRGASLLGIQKGQATFQATVMLAPKTGGTRSLWVKDPNGKLVVNETLASNTEPPSPQGYFGFYALSFPMSVNGTYEFGITNSWGISSMFQTYDNIMHLPPPSNEEYFLMTFFGFLLVGLYFLGKIARRDYKSNQSGYSP